MTVPEEASALSATALGPRKRSSAAGTPQRRLRVRVSGLAKGDTIVDLTIPVNLVGVGVNLGARLAPQLDPEATQRLIASIDNGASGLLLDLDDPEQGEHLTIWVE